MSAPIEISEDDLESPVTLTEADLEGGAPPVRSNEPGIGEQLSAAATQEIERIRRAAQWLDDQGWKAVANPLESVRALVQGASHGGAGWLERWLDSVKSPTARKVLDQELVSGAGPKGQSFEAAERAQPLPAIAGSVAAPVPILKGAGALKALGRVGTSAVVGGLNAATRGGDAADIALGTVVGGAFGTAAEVPAAARATHGALREFAGNRAAASMGPELRAARATSLESPSQLPNEMVETGLQMLDEGHLNAGPGGIFPASRQTIAQKSGAAAGQHNTRVNQLAGELDQVGAFKPGAVAERIEEKIISPVGDLPQAEGRLSSARRAEQWFREWETPPKAMEPSGLVDDAGKPIMREVEKPVTQRPKTFTGAQGVHRDLRGESTPTLNEERRLLAGEIHAQGSALAPEVAGEMRAANQKASRAADVSEAATGLASRASPADLGVAAAGGLVGGTIAGPGGATATAVVGAVGNHLAQLYGNQVAAKVSNRIAKVLGSMTLSPRAESALRDALHRGPAATMATLYSLGLMGTGGEAPQP